MFLVPARELLLIILHRQECLCHKVYLFFPTINDRMDTLPRDFYNARFGGAQLRCLYLPRFDQGASFTPAMTCGRTSASRR